MSCELTSAVVVQALYGVHKSNQVYKMLEEHRIGNLAKADREAAANAPVHGSWVTACASNRLPYISLYSFLCVVVQVGEGPYAHDPERHPAFLIRSEEPFNGETPGG
jgi:hypothetical protein